MTATVHQSTDLRCDGYDDGRRCAGKFGGDGHWTYVRGKAAECGWTYNPMKGDFCPEHTKEAS